MRGRKRVSVETVSTEDIDSVFGQEYDFGTQTDHDPDRFARREREALENHWNKEEFPFSLFPGERVLDVQDEERRNKAQDCALLPAHLQPWGARW